MARVNPKAKKDTVATPPTKKITTPTPYGQTKSNGFTAAQIAQVRALQTNQNQGTGVTKVTTQITPKLVQTLFTPRQTVYASTQKTGKSTIYAKNSQNPVNVATNNTTKAQPQFFTKATTISGNTYTIPAEISLQARQYYQSLGITTTQIKNPDWQGASKQDVKPNENLVGAGTDKTCGIFGCATVQVGKLGDPVKSPYDSDLPSVITKEENPIANDVQLGANPYTVPNDNGTGYVDMNNAGAPNADPRYDDGKGKVWDSPANDPLMILSGCEGNQSCFDQWMSQMNEEIVPTNAYEAFTVNKNGSQSINAGVDNIKNTFGNILQSKWFPFVIIGIVGLIVLSLFRGKSGSSVPTKVFNF